MCPGEQTRTTPGGSHWSKIESDVVKNKRNVKVKLWSPDGISVGGSLKGAGALQKKDARLDKKLALSDAEKFEKNKREAARKQKARDQKKSYREGKCRCDGGDQCFGDACYLSATAQHECKATMAVKKPSCCLALEMKWS